MRYKLRDYQLEASDIGVEKLTKNNPQPFILQLATGAGKSIIIADIVNKLNANVLVLQPNKELVEQNYDKMMSYKPEFRVGVYCAALKRKEIKQVTYATIQSIHKKSDLFDQFEYVIIDECHQVDPKNLKGMYTSFLKSIECKRVCGLTATPYRLTQRFYYEDGEKYYTAQLKMVNRIYPYFFKSIAYKVETDQLIKEGYLSPILYRNVDIGDMSVLRLNSTGADYNADDLVEFWRSDRRLQKLADCIAGIDKHCQRNLIFCSSLLQARRAQEMLKIMNIRSEVVSGDTSLKDRTELVRAYRAGEFKHMLNVGVFTTGFDVPELDSVVLARPTVSLALYYQMVGRGVRLDPARPDKKLRVYDLVQLNQRLGRVETIKVTKEIDPETGKPSWKDEVTSEVGVMTNTPLFTFKVKKE